jgi:hypothetical protein
MNILYNCIIIFVLMFFAVSGSHILVRWELESRPGLLKSFLYLMRLIPFGFFLIAYMLVFGVVTIILMKFLPGLTLLPENLLVLTSLIGAAFSVWWVVQDEKRRVKYQRIGSLQAKDIGRYSRF